MFNWNEICTKYRSYQLNNDYGGMVATLNQIKSHYGLISNAHALALINERCEQYYPTFRWELPTNPEAQIDCYDCRAQIMQRFMAVEGCPSGWLSSPVSASTNTSKNPCEQRNTTSGRNFGTTNWAPIKFYESNGRSVGDPVMARGGSLRTAVNDKIGSTLPAPKARNYQITRGQNRNVIGGTPTRRNPMANPVINPDVRARRKTGKLKPRGNYLQRMINKYL